MGHRVVCIVAALALVFGFVPASAFAAAAETLADGQRSDEETEATIAALLNAGDYVEGEAIVCSLPAAPSGSGGLATQSADGEDLLGGAEVLSTVTERQYAEATGEGVVGSDAGAAGEGALSAQSAQEGVRISIVRSDELTTEELIRQLLADPRVLSAEPNYVMQFADEEEGVAGATGAAAVSQLSATTADLGLSTQAGETTYDMTDLQWSSQGAAATTPQYLTDVTNPGLRVPNWGATGEANASGVVAVMDSGVDHKHPDLVNVMYHFAADQQEALGCGEYGYAPSRTDHTNTMDYLNHGTHCAGIVAAEWNGFGVSGVANGVKICAVSISESETSISFSCDGIVKGFDFLVRAAESGVDIRAVNCSFEVSPTSNATAAVIQAAGEAGIVTCFASGNNGLDLEADYSDIVTKQQSPYMLRVNASRPQDDRAWFSNYGSYLTDVFSPGSAILSTIPTGVDDSWHYFPQADTYALYKETSFNDGSPLPHVYIEEMKSDGSTVLNELQVSKANDIGVDGDSASLQFSVSITVGKNNAICIDVPADDPAGSLNDADIQDVGFALYLDSFEIRLVRTGVQLSDGTYPEDGSRTDNSLYGWVMCGFHASDSMSFKRIEHDGKSYLRLRFDALFNDPALQDFEVKTVDARLDQIAIGKKGNGAYLPYRYMNGTSMATPAIAGCAAVVSSTVTAASPGERAAETVRILKGAMHQTSGYSGLCKQGGQVDLGILGQTDKYVPVIEAAEVSGSTVTVKGAYFGSTTGTLTVGGKSASPSSWSATEIVAPWPAGAKSGVVPVSVKSGVGQTTRAFMLSAPADDSEHADVYERDLAVPNVRADGLSTTVCPYNLIATDDGVLYAVAVNGDDQMDETTGYLFRSDDAGASWLPIALPKLMKRVSLAAGDGVVYLVGATPPGSLVHRADAWHLYSFDTAKGEFAHLRDYSADSDSGEMPVDVALAYAGGNLYAVDCHSEGDYGDAPSHMRIRKFDGSYQLGDGFTLKHDYQSAGSYDAPKVSVAGNSIYVCDLQSEQGGGDKAAYGLERVDVAADGSISCADLSSAFAGLPDDVEAKNACIAASDDGVYLVGKGLDALLPDGTVRTDTFFLEKGASAFEPYSRTLSLAPVFTPVAVCSGGWLYAFAVSEYEKMPVFGRATKVAEDPDPAVSYAFTEGDGSSWTKGSADRLAFTVKRSVSDDQTFTRFAGVQVDGEAVDPSCYDAKAGSLNLALLASYLGTLPVGNHELKALFDDGSATATFTVRAAPAKGSPAKTPSTGDALPAAAIIALAALAVAAAAAAAWAARRRRLRR